MRLLYNLVIVGLCVGVSKLFGLDEVKVFAVVALVLTVDTRYISINNNLILQKVLNIGEKND